MPSVKSVTVAKVDSKSVVARGRSTLTYSFQGNDNQWYRTNFKDHGLKEGDVVSFDYSDGKYGKDVDVDSIKKEGTAPVAAMSNVRPMPSSRAGVFPIPAEDGQRSIIRQNALTNARELVMAAWGKDALNADLLGHTAVAIIAIARAFEDYTSGYDAETEEAVNAKAAA